MTREGLTLMASGIEPCGTRDIILLTAPANERGARSNFNNQSLEVTGPCASQTLRALLHVRGDATVEVTASPGGVIEIRVPRYAGNIEASHDLRDFDVKLRVKRVAIVETPIGRLETRPEGDAQVFRIALDEPARTAQLYYYSERRLHAVQYRDR